MFFSRTKDEGEWKRKRGPSGSKIIPRVGFHFEKKKSIPRFSIGQDLVPCIDKSTRRTNDINRSGTRCINKYTRRSHSAFGHAIPCCHAIPGSRVNLLQSPNVANLRGPMICRTSEVDGNLMTSACDTPIAAGVLDLMRYPSSQALKPPPRWRRLVEYRMGRLESHDFCSSLIFPRNRGK